MKKVILLCDGKFVNQNAICWKWVKSKTILRNVPQRKQFIIFNLFSNRKACDFLYKHAVIFVIKSRSTNYGKKLVGKWCWVINSLPVDLIDSLFPTVEYRHIKKYMLSHYTK